MEFFIKDEDQKLAEQATDMDDIDMICSPIDGKLVVVAVKRGGHVCQQCGKGFDPSDPKLRGVEVKMGTAWMLLHAQCENGKPRPSVFFHNKIRGMQVRRKLAQAAHASEGVAAAAEAGASKVIV